MEQYTADRFLREKLWSTDDKGSFDYNGLRSLLEEFQSKIATASPAKAEQEGLRWVNFSEFKFNTPDVFTLRRIDDKRSTVSLFIDETTDIADLIRRQFGSITYSVQLEYLSESTTPPAKEVAYDELWDEFSEHVDDDIDSLSMFAGRSVLTETQYNKLVAKLKAPPGYEALQPPFPRSVDDRIIARRNLYMSLEQAVYQKGYEEGKQSVAPGLRWIKGAPSIRKEYHAKVKSKLNPDISFHGIIYPVKESPYWWATGNDFNYTIQDHEIVEYLSDSPAPVQVDPVSFHKWIKKEGWEPHSSGDYWYKLDYPSQWPTPHTCLEQELIALYTQSLQPKP